MSFPETRPTLIHRIARHNDEDAWREFFDDYWKPVCSFAARSGHLSPDDAEDIAAATFVALISSRLVSRWDERPISKFRSLICSVTRKVLANRIRVETGRKRIGQQRRDTIRELSFVTVDDRDASIDSSDALLVEWFHSLVASATRAYIDEARAAGRFNSVRVLYGRICEGMTVRAVGEALNLAPSTVDSLYAQARRSLEERLRSAVNDEVRRYCGDGQLQSEFELEWSRLGSLIDTAGGIEAILKEQGDWSVQDGTGRVGSESFTLVAEESRRRMADIEHEK